MRGRNYIRSRVLAGLGLGRAVRRVVFGRLVDPVHGHGGRHDVHRLPGPRVPLHVRRIRVHARQVYHGLGALPVRHQRALLHQRGRQVAAAALAAAPAALHAVVDGHGQRHAGRHQRLAGQRHQRARAHRGHRARGPVHAVVVLLLSTLKTKTRHQTHIVILLYCGGTWVLRLGREGKIA